MTHADHQEGRWQGPLRPLGGVIRVLCSQKPFLLGSMPQAIKVWLISIVHWVLASLPLIQVVERVVC